MKYYPLLYRLDAEERYLIWTSDEKDGAELYKSSRTSIRFGPSRSYTITSWKKKSQSFMIARTRRSGRHADRTLRPP